MKKQAKEQIDLEDSASGVRRDLTGAEIPVRSQVQGGHGPGFDDSHLPLTGSLAERIAETTEESTSLGMSSELKISTKTKRLAFCQLFMRQSKEKFSNDRCKDECMSLIECNLNRKLTEEENKSILSTLKYLKNDYSKYWSKSSRRESYFLTKYSCWLNEEVHYKMAQSVRVEKEEPQPGTSSSFYGRPPLTFGESAARTKRRKIKELEKSQESILDVVPLLQATAKTVKQRGSSDIAAIIQHSLISPGRPAKMMARISQTKDIIPYTTEEALSLILDEGMSVKTYKRLRDDALQRNAKLYPPYYKVLEEKNNCRPPKEDLFVSELEASIGLQSLLHHTASRILKMQIEVLKEYFLPTEMASEKLTLICSWGFDGSTGQSNYKQKFGGGDESTDTNTPGPSADSSLFATTLIPLRCVSTSGKIIWQNMIPQSIRFCRPISLKFVKETPQVILETRAKIEDEISQLENLKLELENVMIEVDFKLCLTVIDGKVLNTITGTTSAQRCPICGVNPSDMNNLNKLEASGYPARDGTLEYGISPLHAWIRFLEWCLHISYKLEIRTWQARGAENKAKVKAKKNRIQDLLWREMGLRVDFTNAGGSGTSNDGNTARRAFTNYKAFAKHLGLNEEFVLGLRTILIAISSPFPINAQSFGEYCLKIAKIYLSNYEWYLMPSTAHKIFAHGAEIIANSILPVGMLAEEAGESKNKTYKSDRLLHSRHISRIATMTDMFNRSLDTSDPIVSSHSLSVKQRKRKKSILPQEVIMLLEDPPLPEGPRTTLDYEEEGNVSGEYDDLEEQLFNLLLGEDDDLLDI